MYAQRRRPESVLRQQRYGVPQNYVPCKRAAMVDVKELLDEEELEELWLVQLPEPRKVTLQELAGTNLELSMDDDGGASTGSAGEEVNDMGSFQLPSGKKFRLLSQMLPPDHLITLSAGGKNVASPAVRSITRCVICAEVSWEETAIAAAHALEVGRGGEGRGDLLAIEAAPKAVMDGGVVFTPDQPRMHGKEGGSGRTGGETKKKKKKIKQEKV